MKNQKTHRNLCSLAILVALTTNLTITANANDHISIEQTSNSTQLYTFECNNTITSAATSELFEALEGKPGDITFKANIGDDEVTIGYYGIINSYESILSEVEEEIAAANEIYTTKLHKNSATPIHNTMTTDISNVIVDKITFEGVSIPESIAHNYNISIKNTVTITDETFALNATSTTFTNRHSSNCDDNLVSPHKGDGHSRYSDGYAWHPDVIQVGFKNNYSSDQNRVEVYYEYYSTTDNLENLQHDADEGLEVKVTFYNYGTNGTSYIDKYYMDDLDGVVWTTNQPTAYLDTLFENDEELPFCVGVEDANDLITNKFYYWTIRNTAGTNNNKRYDGAFKVAVQRTYAYSDFATWWGSRLDGIPDSVTWERFSEEHEGTMIPGVSPNASNNWQSDSAWDYADSHTEWEYNTLNDDPLKVV